MRINVRTDMCMAYGVRAWLEEQVVELERRAREVERSRQEATQVLIARQVCAITMHAITI